ncbi:MAG: DEAD/DEAH box helicase [Hyphomicrobiaceae bacterium]|nr:DEAD/DEAH box helicase [Hyphomicrobiaceae bacterium]
MTDFTTLGLAEPILRAVATEGYTTPTPIQRETIPALINGRDVLGIAQTGTGKTAAFVLPMLHHLSLDHNRPAPKTAKNLILAPTRELVAQIADCVKAYGRNLRFNMAVVVGGVKPGPQIRSMSQGVDILVATPGRLLDLMASGAIRLDHTRGVVLDEADQMMDIGFLPAIKRIMEKLPKARQTVLLSATMPAPIKALADGILFRPVEVSVAPQSKPVDAIDQQVILLPSNEKRDRLVDILSKLPQARAIVFTRTKRGADKVAAHLDEYGFKTAAIHGNKSQGQRERALDSFRDNKVQILVATDIAARGIDVDGVTHVINFEMPNVPEAYVHRIGRTARAGATGAAISLVDGTERGLLKDVEKLIGRSLGATGSFGGDDRGTVRPQSRTPHPGGSHGQKPARGGSAHGHGGGHAGNGGNRSHAAGGSGRPGPKPAGRPARPSANPNSPAQIAAAVSQRDGGREGIRRSAPKA